MSITASQVKELRTKTGAGMMDCKKALNENNGDMEASIDWLRTKGIAKASKKADRIAAEGLVGVSVSGTSGSVVEVNSETDFVARNETFQDMVRKIAALAIGAKGDTATLVGMTYTGRDVSVAEHIQEQVGSIGENMSLRRAASLSVDNGAVASYIHNAVTPELGKIGVLVGLESTGDQAKLTELGRQVAMHVAATNPLSANRDDLDPAVVEKERNALIDQAKESGKPDNIIEKMVEGRIRKFYEEVVLVSQTFVIDGENTVEQALKNAESDIGAPIVLKGFVRFELGEGIAKRDDDFAAEVAAAAAGS